MSFGKRQPNNNGYYKLLGDLKILRRDQRRFKLAAADTSLPESTREMISAHLLHIEAAIERHELDLVRRFD